MFLFKIPPEEMAVAQHNMLTSGVAVSQLWRMWQENSDILPDEASKLKTELPINHILRHIMAEHEMMLCFTADLDDTNENIQKLQYANSTTEQIRLLAHITGHLAACNQHCERENEIIFTEIKRRGYNGLLNIIREQHDELVGVTSQLNKLVWKIDSLNFDYFKAQLHEFVKFLVPLIGLHIFIENNIIFPLAVGLVNDNSAWQKLKGICNQIGYCGYDANQQ
jgi:DUF438 domain-containing protein